MSNSNFEWQDDALTISQLNAAAEYFRESAARHKSAEKEMRNIFLITGVVVLSLCVVVLSTMAWFVNNKVVSGTGVAVNLKEYRIEIPDYLVYYCTKNTDGTFTYNSSLQSSGQITMMNYDAIMGGTNNQNTALIFRVPVSQNEEFSSTNSHLLVTVGRDTNAKWHTASEGSSSVYMSSVVEVKCAGVAALQGTDDDVDETQNEQIYTAATTELADASHTASTFVDKTNPASGTYQKELNFLVTDGFKVYHKTVGEKEVYFTYVYIQMDYCPALINKFYGITSGYGDIGSTDFKQTFKNDSSKIAISIVSNK